MPTKKKYNARFPPARIKKIMQTDEDIGKVAAPVPVILSKALEIFMQSLLETACKNTQARHAKTMSTAHLKQCITSESQFDFLKELVENIPDLPTNEEEADDIDEPKPKRKRMVASSSTTQKEKAPRKQRTKKEKRVDSDSDEDYASDEDESSNSTGSGSNPGFLPTNSRLNTNSPSTVTKPTHDHVVPPNNLVPPTNLLQASTSRTSLQIPNTSIPSFSAPSLYQAAHSEDDDYDS